MRVWTAGFACFLGVLFAAPVTWAQDLAWAKRLGGATYEDGSGVAVDAAGNVFTVGSFSTTADFDPGPGVYNLTSPSSTDVFISKLDAGGNFVWAKRLGGTGQQIGQGIAVDTTGNVYTVGQFAHTIDCDPGPGSYILTPAGDSDVFISKLDNDGNFVWARQLGGASEDLAYGVAVDADGNVYTVGYFSATAFVSKHDSAGNFVWSKQVSGTNAVRGRGITLDGAGNVYTVGQFYGTADFDPGPGIYNLTSEGGNAAFVWKLDSDGDFVWVRQVEGPDDSGYGITHDAAGDIYAIGYFFGTADFDPGPGTYDLHSTSNGDAFIWKLNSNGNFLWARHAGDDGDDVGLGVTVDLAGNVYTVGAFYGTVDFDPGPTTFELTAAGSFPDAYIWKLDSNGEFVWAGALGAIGGSTAASRTVSAPSGSVYIVGSFYGTVDFSPGPNTHQLVSAGNFDAFVLRLGRRQLATGDLGIRWQ